MRLQRAPENEEHAEDQEEAMEHTERRTRERVRKATTTTEVDEGEEEAPKLMGVSKKSGIKHNDANGNDREDTLAGGRTTKNRRAVK